MRKICFAVFMIILLFLCGCKKQYTCTCTTQTDYKSAHVSLLVYTKSVEGNSYKEKMTKKQAISACEHEETSIQSLYENMLSNNGKDTVTILVTSTCILN